MLPKSMSAFVVILALGLALPGLAPLYGAQEDTALFQEALSPYGQWLNHGQHGLVWRPTQVARSWRPYTNGRWVPTQEGYVFETEEPWGWATYHYGNWLSTQEYGWVWSPGRTWYPHTVNWRSNDDNVGWAPVPPPDYGGPDSYPSGGYTDRYGASSGLNSYGIPPSSWVFTRASDFLLGWDQPYASRYSYANAGLLLGPQYIPVVYERTMFVNNFVTPSYAPRACYNWGPPVTYITKVTNIKNIDLERRGRERRLHHLRNVMPPEQVSRRHPAWREVLPVADETRQRHIRSSAHAGKLNRPDAIPAPRSLARPPAAGVGRHSPPAPEPAAKGPGRDLDRRPAGRQSHELGQMGPPLKRTYPPHRLMTGANPAATPVQPAAGNQPLSGKEAVRPLPPAPLPPRQVQAEPGRPAATPASPRQYPLGQAPAPRPQHQPPSLEQELRHRQQRVEMERRQRAHQDQPPQQAHRQQQVQMEQQRRQADLAGQQEMQRQQQRQLEMQRQQQVLQEQQRQQARQHQLQMENQRRQAEMQQRQEAQMMRARQMQQQQQMVRQAPPAPPAPAPPPRQKKKENQ